MCALMQVPLIAASCCAGPDLVSGGGGCTIRSLIFQLPNFLAPAK